MAGGAGDLSPSMFIDDQSMKEKRIVCEIAFHHFRKNKVEISSAIKKTFPFLEGLRDRELISNKMFEDFQDSCSNLVPVQKIVYKVLSELEKKFNPAVLEALFSEVNMQEYPDLIRVQKSFRNAVQERLYSQVCSEEEIEDRLEQGTGEHSFLQSLTWPRPASSSSAGTSSPQNGFPESLHETEQRNKRRKVASGHENEAQGSLEEPAQESVLVESGEQGASQVNARDTGMAPCQEEKAELFRSGIQMPSCFVPLVDIKKEKPFFHSEVEHRAQARTNTSEIIVISSEEESEDLNDDGEEPPAVAVSPVISNQDILEAYEEEETREATCSRQISPVFSNYDLLEPYKEEETQEATCSRQISPEPLDFRNSPTFRKNLKKREGGHERNSSESSEEELPPVPWSSAPTGPTNSRNISRWTPHSKKRLFSSSGALELGHGEESQESLRSGSGKKRRYRQETNHFQIEKKESKPEMCSTPSNEVPKKRGWPKGKKRGNSKISSAPSNEVPKKRGWQKGKKRGSPKVNSTQNNKVPRKRGRPKERKRINSEKRGRKRVQRIPRGKNVNLHLPELPVTCGSARGTLFKERLKLGVREKSIKSVDGRWFTPREFEIEGKMAASKNWRMSIRCHLCPLKNLIKKGYLLNPPRSRKKFMTVECNSSTFVDPYPENSNECEVCCQGGLMFCCDTCPRSYHKNCHIPPANAKKGPWSCILCRTKAIRKRSRVNQRLYQESEVLERQMLPEEQLICELLLLKVYCSSESAFFAPEPCYSQQATQGPQEPMWLDKIKERLSKKAYPRVEGFVRDMRLIFQNHKTFYKDKKFIRLDLTIETNFEKNFKKIFAIQETSKNS